MNVQPRTTLVTTSMLVAALAVVGCVGAPGSAPPAGRPSQSAPARLAPSTSVPVVGEVPPAIVDAATSMLETKVGAEAAASAAVVVAETVTWPDGSLGCPVPGQSYTQVPVPGYRLVFEVDGSRYDYRATDTGYIRLCEPGGPRAS
jgi:hypothetical protein